MKPHIVLTLADDLGYNGVGYNNKELLTPAIDRLAQRGLILDSFYTYRLCGPSRASLLTGRMPYKLEATRTNFIEFWEESGTELAYSMLPQQLRKLGYSTHMIGKWHQGFYHPKYLPLQRGFDSFFGFLGGCEDHVTQRVCPTGCEGKEYPGVGKPIDLFRDNRPALGENGSVSGFSHNCLRFGAAAVQIIRTYAARGALAPLFLFLSLQDPHAPIQTPPRFENLYSHPNALRNRWSGMVSAIDETVANVTSALRDARLWARTLFIFASDNGSPVCGWGAAGSNAPLRGGKGTDWEGGVRTPALVSGGWLPRPRRGLRLSGLVHIADLYATFCAVAGAVTTAGQPGCPRDGGAAPVDSIDMSSFFQRGAAHAGPSPRLEIIHDLNGYSRRGADGVRRRSGVIRVGRWKLVAKRSAQAAWFGPFSPEAPANVSAALRSVRAAMAALSLQRASAGLRAADVRKRRRAMQREAAALTAESKGRLRAMEAAAECSLFHPCLYDIAADPAERHDVAKANAQHVDRLRSALIQRWDEFHLGERRFGRLGEKPTQTVTRWRRGYCGAALRHSGFMAPWAAQDEAVRPESPPVRDASPES